MSIEIKITIPDEDINKPDAVQKRMTLLGYVFGRADVPVIGAAALTDSDQQERGTERKPGEPYGGEPAKPELKKSRAKKTEPAPNISAQPEARVDPEVEAQDEADEAAEVLFLAERLEAMDVTAENLRAEMGAYAQKFGMDAALADGSKVFADALGQAPEGGWKLSVVAGIGGETLAKAVAAWRAAAAGEARYGG